MSESDSFSAEVVSAVDDLNRRWKGFADSLGERESKLNSIKAMRTAFDSLHRDIK